MKGEGIVSRHYGAVIEANSRPGPGRGPAPPPPERWWWIRWRMFDGMMWDAIDALDPWVWSNLLLAWPDGWPSPGSGHMSVRQMEWVRMHMIGGEAPDPTGWSGLFGATP